jgi:hypothetical protein
MHESAFDSPAAPKAKSNLLKKTRWWLWPRLAPAQAAIVSSGEKMPRSTRKV